MAATEERLRETEDLEKLWREPSAGPGPRRDASPPGVQTVRPGWGWSRLLLLAWLSLVVALIVFEPRPAEPTATPLWGEVIVFAFTYALLATMIGLATRRSWGPGASAVTGGLGMVIAWACAATGHHVGAWWMVEGAAFAALTAGSLAALRFRH